MMMHRNIYRQTRKRVFNKSKKICFIALSKGGRGRAGLPVLITFAGVISKSVVTVVMSMCQLELILMTNNILYYGIKSPGMIFLKTFVW